LACGARMQTLTEDEAKLYDRQIRLWGVEAQKRVRETSVLLISLNGTNTEVCKNLVLAGISNLTILDDHLATEEDLCCNFFLQEDSIGKNRGISAKDKIMNLNPFVKISCDESSISQKTEDFFNNFSLVCASGISGAEKIRVNNICRKRGVKFFCTEEIGRYGYFFLDLISYQSESNVQEYFGLEDILNHLQKARIPKWFIASHALDIYLQSFQKISTTDEFVAWAQNFLQKLQVTVDKETLCYVAENVRHGLAPVCAIVGGILAQEIIKVVSAKEEAIQNFFFYDAFNIRNPGEVCFIKAS